MTIDRMKDINAFVHVAEAKSFTTAAEQVGLSRSAVGKSIARLEDRLGVRLLQRTTRSVSLTGEGAVLLVGLKGLHHRPFLDISGLSEMYRLPPNPRVDTLRLPPGRADSG